MEDHIYKIVLVGDSNTGKSALASRYIQKRFVSEYETTVENIYQTSFATDVGKLNASIIDTSGAESYYRLTAEYVQRADIIILVYAIDDLNSFNHLSDYKRAIEKLRIDRAEVPVILVANKSDLRNISLDLLMDSIFTSEDSETETNKPSLVINEEFTSRDSDSAISVELFCKSNNSDELDDGSSTNPTENSSANPTENSSANPTENSSQLKFTDAAALIKQLSFMSGCDQDLNDNRSSSETVSSASDKSIENYPELVDPGNNISNDVNQIPKLNLTKINGKSVKDQTSNSRISVRQIEINDDLEDAVVNGSSSSSRFTSNGFTNIRSKTLSSSDQYSFRGHAASDLRDGTKTIKACKSARGNKSNFNDDLWTTAPDWKAKTTFVEVSKTTFVEIPKTTGLESDNLVVIGGIQVDVNNSSNNKNSSANNSNDTSPRLEINSKAKARRNTISNLFKPHVKSTTNEITTSATTNTSATITITSATTNTLLGRGPKQANNNSSTNRCAINSNTPINQLAVEALPTGNLALRRTSTIILKKNSSSRRTSNRCTSTSSEDELINNLISATTTSATITTSLRNMKLSGERKLKSSSEDNSPTDRRLKLSDESNFGGAGQSNFGGPGQSKILRTSKTINGITDETGLVKLGVALNLAKEYGYVLMETSVKDNINLDELFKTAIMLAYKYRESNLITRKKKSSPRSSLILSHDNINCNIC